MIPSLTLPIFDSDRLNANHATTRARNHLLINQLVLNAARDVARASLQMDSNLQQAVMQDEKFKLESFTFYRLRQ